MKSYAITDIETSGGNPRVDRITEICIHLFDGEKIIDTFSTLINPEVPIPYNIVRLTGITNEMVKNAPKFHEVAKRIVEITQNAVFVAHNVRFDYGFVQKEFRNLGYTYSRPQLCTVKLSQKMLPGQTSYGLENLCRSLEITNQQAHRAYGDATATVKLFQILLSEGKRQEDLDEVLTEQIAEVRLPPNLPKPVFDDLPDETGVYYFHDAKGKVIYVGKSNGIKYRIKSHFSEAHKTQRTLRMIEEIHDVSYELCGSELVALLKENEEIKRLLPKYNRAQRRKTFHYGIYSEPDEKGYLRLKIARLTGKEKPESCYTTRSGAEGALKRRIENYKLCMNLCGMQTGSGACFHYQIHLCQGACVEVEPPRSYNERVMEAVSSMNYGKPNFLIVGEGRNYTERSVVLVENGTYMGYAYLGEQEVFRSPDDIKSCVPFKVDSPDVLNIIRTYMRKHPKEVKPF